MKILKLESLPSVLKFKNKEDFSNRIVQEVITICKNNSLFSKNNEKMNKLDKYKEELTSKDKKLDELIKKSTVLKEDLNNKIKTISEENNKFKNRLLQLLGEKNENN